MRGPEEACCQGHGLGRVWRELREVAALDLIPDKHTRDNEATGIAEPGRVLPKHACFPGEAEQLALQKQREGH